MRIAGCSPRAISRSSSSAWASSSDASVESRAVHRRAASRAARWASRSAAPATTSRCCAPSCRLRSRRRRSASPTATIRAREAASCCARLGVGERLRVSSANRCSRYSAPGGNGPVAERDEHRAPQLAVEHDRRADGGREAELPQRLGELAARRRRSCRRAPACRRGRSAGAAVSPSSGAVVPSGTSGVPRSLHAPIDERGRIGAGSAPCWRSARRAAGRPPR